MVTETLGAGKTAHLMTPIKNRKPQSRRRLAFSLGILAGVTIGTVPGYYLWARLAALTPSRSEVGPEAETSFVEPCRSLDRKLVGYYNLLIKREERLALLKAYAQSLLTGDRVGQQPPDSSALNTGSESGLIAEHQALISLFNAQVRQDVTQLGAWWTKLAAAKSVQDSCETTRSDRLAPSAPVVGRSVPGARYQHPAKLALDKLETDFDVIAHLDDFATTLANATARPFTTDLDSSSLPDGSGEPWYLDWSRQRLYAVGESHIQVPISPAGLSDARRAATEQARRRLLQGILRLKIDGHRTFADLIGKNRELQRQAVMVAENADIADQGQLGPDRWWVALRVPLPASKGILPLVIPLLVPHDRTWDRPTFLGTAGHSTARGDAATMNVVIDARGLNLAPVLLPRILSTTGTVIIDPASLEPNALAASGFCSYTSYYGKITYLTAGQTLWITATTIDPAGALVLAEPDAARLALLLSGDRPPLLPLLVVTQ